MNTYKTQNINDYIISILTYCDILPDQLRRDAYNHWYRFLEMCIKYNGSNWLEVYKRLRGAVGIDFRYLDALKDTFQVCGVIDINDGTLHFIGIPNNNKEKIIKESNDEPDNKEESDKILRDFEEKHTRKPVKEPKKQSSSYKTCGTCGNQTDNYCEVTKHNNQPDETACAKYKKKE